MIVAPAVRQRRLVHPPISPLRRPYQCVSSLRRSSATNGLGLVVGGGLGLAVAYASMPHEALVQGPELEQRIMASLADYRLTFVTWCSPSLPWPSSTDNFGRILP